jgi:hypothetical protein
MTGRAAIPPIEAIGVDIRAPKYMGPAIPPIEDMEAMEFVFRRVSASMDPVVVRDGITCFQNSMLALIPAYAGKNCDPGGGRRVQLLTLSIERLGLELRTARGSGGIMMVLRNSAGWS